MKILCLLLLSLFTLSAIADSKIVVTPVRPVNCKSDNDPHVNWVYGIKKLSETEEEVKFEFLTEYGACQGGQRRLTRIYQDLADVVIMQDRIHFGKEGVKRKLFVKTETELRVELTFDKKYLFKKKSERNFAMFFIPGEIYAIYYQNGFPQKSMLEFPWRVKLTLEEDWIFLNIL